MMLYCPGDECPLRRDCYRHTQPSPGRDSFASVPYDPVTQTCEWFTSNIPSAALIRETAYYIWLHRGRPDNCAEEHWQNAYLSLCQNMGRNILEQD